MRRLLRISVIGGLTFASLLGTGSVLATAPASAPTNLSPNGSLVAANPTLSWNAVSGAAKYRVQISTTNTFSSTVYSADTYNTKVTPENQLPFQLLYWRVAGEDASNNVGPFAQATFDEELGAAPVQLTPVDLQTLVFPSQPVIFSWQPVPGAIGYTIQIDDASDFVNAQQYTTVNSSYTLTDTQSFTLNDGVTLQTWYWRVQATFPSSGVTPWSSTWSYQINWPATPQLKSPADGAMGITETVFSWDPIPGAQTYELQVSPNADWQNNKVLDVTVDSTRYAPYPTLNNDSYFWRVRGRAAGSAINYGPWSTPYEFTRSWTTQPHIVSPLWSGGAADPPRISQLVLSWTPALASGAGWVDHASYYQVEISTDLNFSTGNLDCYVNHTEFTPYQADPPAGVDPGSCSTSLTNSLQPGITYYWHVRAIDAVQNSSAKVLGLWDNTSYLDTQRFIFDPGIPDESCGPADGATVSTPVLCWLPVSGAEQYRVTIMKSSGATLQQVTTSALTYTPTIKLNPADGPFKWSVATVDGQGHVGLTQLPYRTFQVADPVDTDTSLQLFTPAAGWAGIRMPSMTWKPYTGASYYKVYYGPTSTIINGTPLSGDKKLPYAGFTYDSPPLAAGTWYWWVQAFDASDQVLPTGNPGDYSLAGSFQIGLNPDYGPWIVPWNNYLTPECAPSTDPTGPSGRCVPTLSDTQELAWVADPNAGAYLVYVAKDVNFTNIVRTYRTEQTRLMPRDSWLDSQAGESFYWFVRPCTDWDVAHCGPYAGTIFSHDNASAYRKVSAAVVGMSASTADNPPGPGATTPNPPCSVATRCIPDQITFNWSDYIGTSQAATYPLTDITSTRTTQEAKEYVFYAATASDFNSGSMLEGPTGIRVDQTQYTPYSHTYPEGPIYWRVQAVDGSNNQLTMSATGLVVKQSPLVTLTSPGNGQIVTGLPFFTWVPQNWAASYQIEVYKNGDTNWSSTNRVFNVSTKVAAWSPTSTMAAGLYAWRVQRKDASGYAGPWSAGRTFTLRPAAPTLIAPANGSNPNGSTLYFSWTTVQNAAKYEIQTSTNIDFTTLKEDKKTVMMAWAPLNPYVNGKYYWRVSSLDSADHVLNTSSIWSFTVGPVPPQPPSGDTYHALPPRRVLDTRPTASGHTNVGLTGKFTAGIVRSFHVAGAHYVQSYGVLSTGTIPANAVAVTGNLTVVNETANGLIALGPTMTPTGEPTTLNFVVGDTNANNVTMGLNGDGTLAAVYRASVGATTDLIFDVTGYFVSQDVTGATYNPLTPGRVLDTRPTSGGVTHIGPAGKLYNRVAKSFSVAGVKALGWPSALVPSNAIAVTGNLTVTNATSNGYLALGPTMSSNPTTSTLNVSARKNRANGVTVALSAGKLGIVWCGTVGSSADAIFDVTGYFTTGGSVSFHPLAPVRYLNTTINEGLSGKFATGIKRTLPIAGLKTVPAGVIGIAGNLTLWSPSSGGYGFIAPSITGTPLSSTLNANQGQIVANGFDVPLSGNGVDIIWMGTSGSVTDFQLDVTGYWK